MPKSLFGNNAIEHWLAPVFEPAYTKLLVSEEGIHTSEYVLMVVSLGIAVAGIYIAWQFYMKRTGLLEKISSRFEGFGRVLLNKYYVDEVYDATVVNPAVKVSEKLLWKGVDVAVIDGALNGLALLVTNVAMAARKVQTGVAQMYAVVFVGGIVSIVAWLLLR